MGGALSAGMCLFMTLCSTILKSLAHLSLQEGSLEQQLLDMGVAKAHIEGLVSRLIAWRTTRQGRRLVDRRRRGRVERNGPLVTAYLEETGVKPGAYV